MNWKVFLTGFVSVFFISFPQNIIGCGGSEDPYDYYTTFFNKNASEAKGYHPFYYTSLLTFYDDWQFNSTPSYEDDPVIVEWMRYTRSKISADETAQFIYSAKAADVESIFSRITTNTAASLPDSIRKNAMARYFLDTKDSSALRYLVFAKKVEQFCSPTGDWEAKPERDSLLLNRYIEQATALFLKSRDNFLKDKWAFQRSKLAFYNNRFTDCIRWCDESLLSSGTSAVRPLAVSYKAGSLFRLGRKAEAAYAYSTAFTEAIDKKKIFLGFLWATDKCNNMLEDRYTALCKNNSEKATMLGMFGLYGTGYKLTTLQKIYALNPSSSVLDILAIREINKLEEQFLTPQLSHEKGGRPYYLSWTTADKPAQQEQLEKTVSFFETLAADKRVGNRGLYYAAAAYTALMKKDYPKVKKLVSDAQQVKYSESVNDQLQLIRLLTAVNEKAELSAASEQEILPMVQWLEQKAKKNDAYRLFYRNFFSEIIAQKYEQQKDLYKAAVCYGAADMKGIGKTDDTDYYTYDNGLEFVRNEMNTADLLKLYALLGKPNPTPFETYLIASISFDKDHVIDVLGTSYLRDFNFAKAIEWLKKAKKPESLETDNYDYGTEKTVHVNVDPFHDYLNDWSRYEKSLPMPYTKLSLALKLQELQSGLDTITINQAKARVYYLLASAFYNISYYGNSWMAVAYNRSTNDWNTGNYSTDWQKEYFSVYKAGAYYKKAYELATDREFKAAALFLQAKCIQRQIPLPPYNYNDWNKYEQDLKLFQEKFMNNTLFPRFQKEFGNTKFYKYASNRCSYLRDFINKR